MNPPWWLGNSVTGTPRAAAKAAVARPVSTSRDSTPAAITMRVAASCKGPHVRPIGGDRVRGAGEQRVVAAPVVLGGHAELCGVGQRLCGVRVRELTGRGRQCDEGRHAGPEPALLVGRLHGPLGREGALGVREVGQQRRLVGDEDADVTRVLGHEGEGVDRASAAGEEVDRAGAASRAPMRACRSVACISGVRCVAAVLAHAAADAARVVRDHGAVGEVRREGVEARAGPWGGPPAAGWGGRHPRWSVGAPRRRGRRRASRGCWSASCVVPSGAAPQGSSMKYSVNSRHRPSASNRITKQLS